MRLKKNIVGMKERSLEGLKTQITALENVTGRPVRWPNPRVTTKAGCWSRVEVEGDRIEEIRKLGIWRIE